MDSAQFRKTIVALATIEALVIAAVAGFIVYTQRNRASAPPSTAPPTADSALPSNEELIDVGTTTDMTNWPKYQSAELGVAFSYPPGYEIRAMPRGTGSIRGGIQLYRSDDLEFFGWPTGSEGPPGISMLVYENPRQQSAIEWARANVNETNFGSIVQVAGHEFERIAGEAALRYRVSGLDEFDYAVIAVGGRGRIVVLSGAAGGPSDTLSADFIDVLTTLQLMNHP